MTRGKQKNKGSPFVNNFTKEDARGRGRAGKRGGNTPAQIYDEDEIRESKLAGGLGTFGGRRKKRGESFQLKYAKRFDDLVISEPLHGQKSEISNSTSFRPPAAKRESTRIQGSGPRKNSSQELQVLNDELSRGKNSAARKNRNMKKSGTQTYNTMLYDYATEGGRRKTTTAEEVHSSDMDATPEVVLPATESWPEVVIDRCGNSENPVASYSLTESHKWGLGYVKEKISEKRDEMFKKTTSDQEPDEHDVQAALDINPAQMGNGRGEERGQSSRKGWHKSAVKEYSRRNRPREDLSRRGFLSIGGLKIYTSDISDTSDDEDSCTDQMDEGFADDGGYMDFSGKYGRGKKRNNNRIGRKKQFSSPDPTRFSAIMLDSSDGDDSYESSDSDISDELVEDYLANCEGLSADIDNPSWISRNQKALQYPHIDEMDIPDEESGSSEGVDLDAESHGIAGSGSELDDDLKHRYRITAGFFRRQVTRRRRSDEATVQGDSDIEIEDLEQKAFFGYDSDISDTRDDKEDALLSDDEVRIRDLELDDEARIRDLELQDNTVRDAIVNSETTGGLVSASVNTETIGGFVSASVNTESVGGLVSCPTEDILLTTSVGTQTLSASTDEARIQKPGLQSRKVPHLRLNMLPKYRSVGQFVSGLAEEVSLVSPVTSQTWPVSTGRTVKKSKGLPGQKKIERQGIIAEKRRQRAVKRGFDLAAVNKELVEMVRLKKDIIAFEPMEQRDRSQVHRLARMYKLKSGSQGTTKRRFVVVSVTKDTTMPSPEDRVRLLRLLGQDKSQAVENIPRSSRTLTGEEQRKLSKMKRAACQALQGLERPVSKKGSKYRYFSSSALATPNTNAKGRSAEKSRGAKRNSIPSGQGSHMKRSDKKASKTAVLFANNPVAFIGSGIESEDACITPASTGSSTPGCVFERLTRSRLSKADAGSSGPAVRQNRSSEFAGFEAHTNGFASRMMAKMGYVEGHGLGREKQGIAQPIEAVIRPKSLGLGAHA